MLIRDRSIEKRCERLSLLKRLKEAKLWYDVLLRVDAVAASALTDVEMAAQDVKSAEFLHIHCCLRPSQHG